MENNALIPHLFRTEYRNIVSVLSYRFGIQHIEIAEDLVSDTFLTATEHWAKHGPPENPTAWLYTVAKNKTLSYLKRHALFEQQLSPEIKYAADKVEEPVLDLSHKNIADSQLAMMFTTCNPVNAGEAQIALVLSLLCGFGTQEIADAFLTNKEVIYKRLNRAKEKLKAANIRIVHPTLPEINERLDTVLTVLYLLFSEGYYSTSQNTVLRKDLCAEAMRLAVLLLDNPATATPAVNALLALMCFHASRFDARVDEHGSTVLYQDQDATRWSRELIDRGAHYLNTASTGTQMSRYHLEAGIAYWHTQQEDTAEKWENILSLYNDLLILEYSPIAALNRTFALAKTRGKAVAIAEAEKLKLTTNPFYYSLLGNLYTDIDNQQALKHYETAAGLTISTAEKVTLGRAIERLREKMKGTVN